MSTAVAGSFGVLDLDAAGVLDELSDTDLQERRATARKLALAYQWAVLHPAPDQASILESPEALGGDGTPEVAARRVAQQTRSLPCDAARWVDEQLAARSDDACGPVVVDRLVAQVTATLGLWRYTRTPDSTYQWHGPYGT